LFQRIAATKEQKADSILLPLNNVKYKSFSAGIGLLIFAISPSSGHIPYGASNELSSMHLSIGFSLSDQCNPRTTACSLHCALSAFVLLRHFLLPNSKDNVHACSAALDLTPTMVISGKEDVSWMEHQTSRLQNRLPNETLFHKVAQKAGLSLPDKNVSCRASSGGRSLKSGHLPG
jgi:hypothetical protein